MEFDCARFGLNTQEYSELQSDPLLLSNSTGPSSTDWYRRGFGVEAEHGPDQYCTCPIGQKFEIPRIVVAAGPPTQLGIEELMLEFSSRTRPATRKAAAECGM